MKYIIEESFEGIGLPQEQMKRLNLKDGDTVFLTEREGGFEITVDDPEYTRQMNVARVCMDKRKGALSKWAAGPSKED